MKMEVVSVQKNVIVGKIIAMDAPKKTIYVMNVKVAFIQMKMADAPILKIVNYLLMAIVLNVNQIII